MPLECATQRGDLVLGKDSLVSHINIVGDNGITFIAAWINVPTRWNALSQTQVIDSLWPLVVDRVTGNRTEVSGPTLTDRPNERGAWFVDGTNVRLGIIARVLGARAVLMSAGTPEQHFGPREERNMLRFLNSFEKE